MVVSNIRSVLLLQERREKEAAAREKERLRLEKLVANAASSPIVGLPDVRIL